MAGEYRVKIMLQGAVADVRAQLALVEKQLKPLQIKLDTGEATKKEIKQYRELATEYKQLSKMVQETDKAMATADANKRKRLEAEAKAQGNAINKNLEASQKQAQVDEANHRKRLQMLQTERQQSQQSRTTQVTQYAPIGGDRSVNLASMERYNQYISQQNSAFKAGKISSEQYIQSMDRIISQTQKWGLANDSVRAKVISNMAQINNTASTSTALQNQRIASNIGNLVGGGMSTRSDELEHIKQLESEQISSINRVRQERISAENKAFDNARRNQQAIDKENQRIASNIGNLISGGMTARGSQLASIGKPIDEAKILNSITRLQQGVTKMTTGSAASYLDPARINQINASISALSSSFRTMTRPEIANEISRIRTSMAGVNGEAQNLSRNSLSLGNTFFKFALWMGVSTVFMQTFNAIRDGVKYIVDMDNALNEIRIVTMQSSEEVAKLAVSYNALGQAMGVSTKAIAITAVDLYRQGLALDEVNERMMGIIKYSKIAGIELAESNKIITATMNNLGVSAEKTIDVMAYMGDASAAGAEEIGVALQRSAATAAEANISFEKISSWVATVSEKTRESAATIGNAMKSILTRYSQIKEKGFNEEDVTNINMVTKALKAAGIVADDGTGQLKAFDQVIDELGGKWGILDAKTRSYIATQMAGIYQGNRFKALMNDYSRSMELYEGSLNSAGVANQKFAIYQESTAAKMDKLKASMEGFWQRSLDAESFKFILEALTALVNSMENLTQVLSFATAALLLYKSGFLSTIPAMLGFTAASATATATATAAGVAATGATTAFTAMQVAMGVFGLIALAVGASITVFDIFNESAQETAQKIADINNEVEKMDGNIDSVKKLAKEFDELNKKSQLSKLSTDDLERFRDIQNQLAEIMPDVVDSYDAEGNAIIKNSEVLDIYIKKLKEERNLKLGENTDSYVKQIEEETKKRNQAIVMLEVNKSRSKNALFSPEEDIEENTKQINEANDAIKNLHKSLLETIPDFSKLEGISKRMAEVLVENMTKVEFGGKINSSNIELYTAKIGEISKKIEEGNIPEKIKQYNELSLAYQQGNGTLIGVTEAYNKLRVELVGTGLSYEQIDKFLKATEKSKASTPIISLASAVAELRKNTSELSKAYEEMDESGSISLQTMEDLLKIHPELQDSITIENGLITISKDLLKNKFDEEKKIRVAELEANKISLESKREEIKEKIRLYGLELTAYQSLLQAYQTGGQQALLDKALNKKLSPMFNQDGKTPEQRKLDLELKNTEEAIKKAEDSANKIKTLRIETSNKKSGKEDPNRAELKTSAKLLETELYSDVNNEIAKYNSLINESEGIVKNTKNLSEQNTQLKKQRELYEGLQKAIHAKAEVARKEKEGLVTEGKAFGFKFTGVGDNMTLENSAKIIADQKNKTDSLRNYTNNAGEDIYKKEEEKYQKMIKLSQRFFDISNKELFEYKNNYTDVGDKIISDTNKINANKIDILFTDVEKNASVFQKQLKLLDDQEKSLDEADFTGKKALKMKELSKVTSEVLKNNKDLVTLSYRASIEGIDNTEEYINRREKLSEVFIENKNKMAELKKEILDTDKEAQKSAEELAKSVIEAQKKSKEIVLDNKKDELARENELKEQYFTKKEWENEDKLKALENEIFGGKQSDYENAMNNRVDLLKNQSDIMQEQEDSLEKQKDLSQKLLDIEKAKKELLNTQNEKNSRLYTGKGFEWVANPKAVRDAQENVSKLQEDYDEIQQKQAKEKAKKEIQNQIDTAQKVYDEKKDSFDKQKDILSSTLEEERKTWSRSKQTRDWAIYEEDYQLGLHYKNIEGDTRTYLDNLKKIYGEKWTEIITELTSKLTEAKALNESLMSLNAKNTSVSISSSPTSSSSAQTSSTTPASIIKQFSDQVSPTNLNTPQPQPYVTARERIMNKVASFDSGGYTGNNEGLAMLHKKELVLNENDTKNILHSVYANRNTVDPISNTVNNSNTNSGTVYNLNNVKIVSENADQLWKNIKGYADKKR